MSRIPVSSLRSVVDGAARAVGEILALGFVSLPSTGCGRAEVVDARSVLLVTFDTTRADRIGAYGFDGAHTPTLDRLASGGLVFEHAVAPTPITLPSHVSILTGLYPSAHGVHDNAGFELSGDATLVSEVLAGEGFRTGAFVGAYVLDRRFGLDQSFEVYRGPAGQGLGTVAMVRRPASDVVDDAIAWFESVAPTERYFVWLHLYDPHEVPEPPEPWRSRLSNRYDAAIAFADAELGRLLDFLDDRHLSDGLLTVVTADHGESLGEHGEQSHGMFVYDAVMRVPLILSGSGLSAPARVERAVTTASIAPTLLELVGISSAAMPHARTGALLTRDTALTENVGEPLYIETHVPFYAHRWHALRGIVWRGH